MAMSIEWRLRDGTDALLMVDASASAVSELSPPDDGVLKSFLAVTGTAEAWQSWTEWHAVDGDGRDPDEWGDLVLSRADHGEVISIDPELFWERVHRRFRSRGVDFGP